MKKTFTTIVFSACFVLAGATALLLVTPSASASQTCTAKCNNGTTVTCTGTVSCTGIDGFGCVSHNRNLPDFIVECP